jgi:iron complex outermembrane receptor protein
MLEPNAVLVAAAFASILALLSPALAAAENPATELEAPTVEVIGTTPLPGIGTPIEQVPANVQAVIGEQIRKQLAPALPIF